MPPRATLDHRTLATGRRYQVRDEFSGLSLQAGKAALCTALNSEYLSIADNASLSAGDVDFWIAGWVYLDSLPATGTQRGLVGKWNGASSEYLVYIEESAGATRLRFIVRNTADTANAVVVANTFGSLAAGTWYFFLAYHDAASDQIRVSVNGSAFDSTAHTGGVLNGVKPFEVGRHDGTKYHDGRIDAVAFGKSPSGGIAAIATTIRDALYNSGSGRCYAELSDAQKSAWGLVSWWDLEEASGSRFDSHGGNNLTDNNTVTQAAGVTSIAVPNPNVWTLQDTENRVVVEPTILNLVANPGAETNTADWTAVTVTLSRTTSVVYSGVGAFEAKPTTGGANQYFTTPSTSRIPVVAGRRYSLQARVRTSVNGQYAIVIAWFDAAGAQIGAEDTAGMTAITAGSWVLASWASRQAPAGAVTAAIRLYCNLPATTDSAYWDNVIFEEGAANTYKNTWKSKSFKSPGTHGDPGMYLARRLRRRRGLTIQARVRSDALSTALHLVVANAPLTASGSQIIHGILHRSTGLVNRTSGVIAPLGSVQVPFSWQAGAWTWLRMTLLADGAYHEASSDGETWKLVWQETGDSTADLWLYTYNFGSNHPSLANVRVWQGRAKTPTLEATFASSTVADSGQAGTGVGFGIAPSPAWTTDAGKLKATSQVNGGPVAWVYDTGKADGVVDCDVTVSAAAEAKTEGIAVRFNGSARYLGIQLNNAADTISLVDVDNGTVTSLGSAALTLADGQTVRLRVVMNGSAYRIYADDVEKLAVTSTINQTATRHGAFTSDTGGTTAARWDNLRQWAA